MAITRPTNIDTPWADAGLKATIPGSSQIGISDGRASWPDGFPPLTMTQIAAGGVPFYGQDMNGILNALSGHTVFQNSGGQYRFDAALAGKIGGYPIGAVLQDDNGINSYRNILAGNTTNFNTTPASIGVSWMPYSASIQATETLAGIAEIATQAEVNAGTDNTRIVTPAKLKATTYAQATQTLAGIAEIATQTETNTGTDNTRIITPLLLRNGMAAQAANRGFLQLPPWLNSFIIQWGVEDKGSSATTGTITFPISYPTAAYIVIPTNTATGPQLLNVLANTPTTTGFTWFGVNTSTGAAAPIDTWQWLSIGR